MKIMSWNVRGLGGAEKRQVIKECIRRCNQDMVVLQETKKEKIVPALVRSTVGSELSSWIAAPSYGSTGGFF